MTEISLIYYWTRTQLVLLAERQREEMGDPERGDGILIWVVMTALLAAAAIAIVAIIVTKAKNTANSTQTQ
jgi:flagellar basal body-associated protein FliL